MLLLAVMPDCLEKCVSTGMGIEVYKGFLDKPAVQILNIAELQRSFHALDYYRPHRAAWATTCTGFALPSLLFDNGR